jgi:hypothetical protein
MRSRDQVAAERFRAGLGAHCQIESEAKIIREQRIHDFTDLLVQIGVLKAKPV